MSESIYQRTPGALSREVDGEVLIVPELREVLDLDDVFYRLGDPVSVRVWELLKEQRTLAELIESVTDEFDADAFPPMIPASGSHRDTWNRDDCLLCHETGNSSAPIVVHEGMPEILFEAKCRSCHVQIRSDEASRPW